MDIIRKLTEELGVQRWQVEAAVKLIDEGNTIPFIARYRKEATGGMDDVALRALDERLSYLRLYPAGGCFRGPYRGRLQSPGP